VRINLLFEASGCCTTGRGIIDKLPDELYSNGLDRSSAETYLKEKLPLVNTVRSPCCAMLMFVICPCLCCYLCARNKQELMQWDMRLREWQNEFNDSVLTKIGHFVKSQSKCTVTYGANGQKERHIERWIAIALTAEESELLRNDLHVIFIHYTINGINFQIHTIFSVDR